MRLTFLQKYMQNVGIFAITNKTLCAKKMFKQFRLNKIKHISLFLLAYVEQLATEFLSYYSELSITRISIT